MHLKKPPCSNCNSDNVVDITYGYPCPEAFEDETFFSGGCCIDEESPAYHCKNCGNDFGEVAFTNLADG